MQNKNYLQKEMRFIRELYYPCTTIITTVSTTFGAITGIQRACDEISKQPNANFRSLMMISKPVSYGICGTFGGALFGLLWPVSIPLTLFTSFAESKDI